MAERTVVRNPLGVSIELVEGGTMPTQAHAGDAGFDLYALEGMHIPAGSTRMVSAGFKMALPSNTCALILPRSGLATRHGISPANAPGLIDSGYRGEVICALHNHSNEGYTIETGERMGQMLIIEYPTIALSEVDALPESERGEGGFGSSGK